MGAGRFHRGFVVLSNDGITLEEGWVLLGRKIMMLRVFYFIIHYKGIFLP